MSRQTSRSSFMTAYLVMISQMGRGIFMPAQDQRHRNLTFLVQDGQKATNNRGATKRRRKEPVKLTNEMPDGPCCGRCDHWTPPGKNDAFGLCHALAVVVDRISPGGLYAKTGEWRVRKGSPGLEKGTVVSVDEAAGLGVDFELLHTRAPGGATCLAFVKKVA